jgi:hypothetical protein
MRRRAIPGDLAFACAMLLVAAVLACISWGTQ